MCHEAVVQPPVQPSSISEKEGRLVGMFHRLSVTPQVHEEECIPEATHRRLSGHASRIVTVLITSSSFWLLADFDGRGKQEEHSFCHSSRSLLFHCIAFRIFNVAATFERTIDFILRGLQWKAWPRQ